MHTITYTKIYMRTFTHTHPQMHTLLSDALRDTSVLRDHIEIHTHTHTHA